MTETIDPAAKRDIAHALSAETARWLVDYYYAVQDYRIQANGQLRAVKQETDYAVAEWMAEHVAGPTQQIEKQIQRALDRYSNEHEAGVWAKSITGIGPVLTAGLLAHIDISKAPTVGHIWRFAGLDPTVRWERKTKRPWNAKLKVLCWKIGDSFCKQSGRAFVVEAKESTEAPERAVEFESTAIQERADASESTEQVERLLLSAPANPSDLYVWLYARRKRQEIERNEQGVFSDQAAASLIEKNFGQTTIARIWYEGRLTAESALEIRALPSSKQEAATRKLVGEIGSGIAMLPPARLELRARRYAVKLFLSHFHHVLYVSTYGEDPPKPYVLTQDDHVHYIGPPNWPPVVD